MASLRSGVDLLLVCKAKGQACEYPDFIFTPITDYTAALQIDFHWKLLIKQMHMSTIFPDSFLHNALDQSNQRANKHTRAKAHTHTRTQTDTREHV